MILSYICFLSIHKKSMKQDNFVLYMSNQSLELVRFQILHKKQFFPVLLKALYLPSQPVPSGTLRPNVMLVQNYSKKIHLFRNAFDGA